VIRTVSSRPVRLNANANTGTNQTTFTIETVAASTGKCGDGTTDKVSGFCANSHGLIANCTRARVFQVGPAGSIAAGAPPAPSTLTLSANMGLDPVYTTDKTEVFPMQTLVYYVKRSSSGTTTSLYRRIFDGDNAAGLEQELIEGVENMQVRYGIDTTMPDPDGIVDKYVEAKGATAADSVTDWNKVVAVRVGLLMRSAMPVERDVSVAGTGAVNGVTVTYPGGTRYDRRVFTTTVAVRNKIAYF
jgi:type IV pilus assembly protein PilW